MILLFLVLLFDIRFALQIPAENRFHN